MHYKLKKFKNVWFFCQTLPICIRNSGFSIIKSVANLKISWSFSLKKILRSTRTLDCDKYRLKLKGRFFSFCSAIFLYFSTPISWVMIRNVITPRFVDILRRWVECLLFSPFCSFRMHFIFPFILVLVLFCLSRAYISMFMVSSISHCSFPLISVDYDNIHF